MIDECVQVGAKRDHGKCSGKVTGDSEVTRDCVTLLLVVIIYRYY